jgi:KaiC/GvpD/RAD55 family RecA-like ATPase
MSNKVEPKFYSYDEYLKLPRNPSKWIIHELLPVGFTDVYAKPKAGKSLLLLAMAEAIVNEEPDWEGFPIDLYGNVLYLQVDTPREIWADNMSRMRMNPERKYDLYCADLFTTPGNKFDILQKPQDAELVNGIPVNALEWLTQEIHRINPILIVLDTLREIHNEDEDKSGAMKKVIQALQQAAGMGRGIVIISHSKKDSSWTTNDEDDIMDQNRGTTYIPGKMDMMIRMTKKELQYKGRAIGYKKEKYKQDERWFPVLIRDEDGKSSQISDVIRNLIDNNPNLSKNQLAMKLAAITRTSTRHATRRIDEWNEQQAARTKALERIQKEPLTLFTPNGTQINLESGLETPLDDPKDLVNLWNIPLSL